MTNPSADSLNKILEDAQTSKSTPLITGAMLLYPELGPSEALKAAKRIPFKDRHELLSKAHSNAVTKTHRRLFKRIHEQTGTEELPAGITTIAPTLSLWKDFKHRTTAAALHNVWLATPLLGVDNTKRFSDLTFKDLYQQATTENEKARDELMRGVTESVEFKKFIDICKMLSVSYPNSDGNDDNDDHIELELVRINEKISDIGRKINEITSKINLNNMYEMLSLSLTSENVGELIEQRKALVVQQKALVVQQRILRIRLLLIEVKALKQASLLSSTPWHTMAGLVADERLARLRKVVLLAEDIDSEVPPLTKDSRKLHELYTSDLTQSIVGCQRRDMLTIAVSTYFFTCASLWSGAYYLSHRQNIVFPLNYRRLFLMCLAISTAAVILTLLPTFRRPLSSVRNLPRSSKLKNELEDYYHSKREVFITKNQELTGITFETLIEAYKKEPSRLDDILANAKTTLLSSEKHSFPEEIAEKVIASWKATLTSWTLSHEERILHMAIAAWMYSDHDEPCNGSRAWIRLQEVKLTLNTNAHPRATTSCIHDLVFMLTLINCPLIATFEALVYFIAYKIAHRINPALQEKMLWLIVLSVALCIHLTLTVRGLKYNPYSDDAGFKLGTYEDWDTACEELSPESSDQWGQPEDTSSLLALEPASS